MKHLTIHARLLKGCNADCSYCSSWVAGQATRMTPDDYIRSLEFIVQHVVPVMGCGGHSSTCTVQYVGGEILLVPKLELVDSVLRARDLLYQHFGQVIDGAQSNLIASERRILDLDTLFGGNIGTSVDGRGVQRTVNGNSDAYKRIFDRSRQLVAQKRGRSYGSIFVVDQSGAANLEHEINEAHERGYGLVLRPVFNGGKEVTALSIDEICAVMGAGFDQWVMNSTQPVEPFMHLMGKRIKANIGLGTVCPFQSNCARVSINLEPNGDMFTCLDMADSNQYPFGNALTGTFNHEVWATLAERSANIDMTCLSCPYYAECQGGCMSEGIHNTGSVYGKTHLCALWKCLFQKIDLVIEKYGIKQVQEWYDICASR